jgi:hypothetical protein
MLGVFGGVSSFLFTGMFFGPKTFVPLLLGHLSAYVSVVDEPQLS